MKYPKTGTLLPGWLWRRATEELRDDRAPDAELVLIGTPIDLRRLIDFDGWLRVSYRL